METFDLCILGSGVAGTFAALKIAKEHKNIKTILFELGRSPHKRRSQMSGFLGLLPNSDGKLYLNDYNKVSDIVGNKRAKISEKWFNKTVSDVLNMKAIKDKGPSINAEKRIKKAGFELSLNSYVQLYPKDIHILSKYISNIILGAKNITTSFDNEVLNVVKQKGMFIITSSSKEVMCKKLIICAGRSSWRWTKSLYDSLGIMENNDVAQFGIRIEATTNVMKDFNKSNCSISDADLNIGPLCWGGTVIPEDHFDLAISSFRSNENRWKSDKVSFNLMGNRYFENAAVEQTSRIGQLTFILSNDRIIKEKISTLLNKKSKISIIPEYDWLPDAIKKISTFMPDILTKGYFHVPTILPVVPKINIGNNLETELDGLYVAGESAGTVGILSAAYMGIIGAQEACK